MRVAVGKFRSVIFAMYSGEMFKIQDMRRAMITAMMAGVLAAGSAACAQNTRQTEPVPGKDGNKYVPYEERTGNESIVYFTRDLSPECIPASRTALTLSRAPG